MSAELDIIMKGLGNQPGVIGTMVINSCGLPIRTTFKEAESIHYASLVSEFFRKTRSSVEPLMDGTPIDTIRIRSNKEEIIIIPDTKVDAILIVVQDASEEAN